MTTQPEIGTFELFPKTKVDTAQDGYIKAYYVVPSWKIENEGRRMTHYRLTNKMPADPPSVRYYGTKGFRLATPADIAKMDPNLAKRLGIPVPEPVAPKIVPTPIAAEAAPTSTTFASAPSVVNVGAAQAVPVEELSAFRKWKERSLKMAKVRAAIKPKAKQG